MININLYVPQSKFNRAIYDKNQSYKDVSTLKKQNNIRRRTILKIREDLINIIRNNSNIDLNEFIEPCKNIQKSVRTLYQINNKEYLEILDFYKSFNEKINQKIKDEENKHKLED